MSPDAISVLGTGVAGLCAATALAERGLAVELIEDDAPAASRLAGGMLAPDCEGEVAPRAVVSAGRGALAWWRDRVGGVEARGTLVVAPRRDAAELDRFARATRGHDAVDPGDPEPELAGRFARGLLFAEEGHLDPEEALAALRLRLAVRGVAVRRGAPGGRVVDCRGLAARDRLSGLRAVRGEMLLLDAPEVRLSRPVRLLHPRFPCYVVPRGGGRYMVGATMVETDREGPVTVEGAMELLSAAWTLHPGFGSAGIVATGAGLRPAFADNVPRVLRADGRWHLNGLYRHGFLTAPALAEELACRMAEEAAHAH